MSSDSAQNLLTGLIALEDPPLVELDLNVSMWDNIGDTRTSGTLTLFDMGI